MLSIKDYIKLNYKDRNIVELESLRKKARVLVSSNDLCQVFYDTFKQGEVTLTIPSIMFKGNMPEYNCITEMYYQNKKVFPLIQKPWADDLGDVLETFFKKLWV